MTQTLTRALVVAGGTGALGNEVLRRLVGAQRYSATYLLAREPLRAAMAGVHISVVPADGDIVSWPPLADLADAKPVDTAVVMFDPPRMYYDRERALYTPTPQDLPALAAWLHGAGVRTLAVVLPHAQGRLPEALKHGLAGLDEHAVASLGFERVLLIRSAQKPGGLPSTASIPQRVAHWMLSIFQYMIPTSEQPPRASKVAEFVDFALRSAPKGVHVASPQTVWRATQGNAAGVIGEWLGPAGGAR